MKHEIKDFIGVFEDAFSKDYCDSVINYFEEAAAAGLCVSRQQQNGDAKIIKDDLQLYGHQEGTILGTKELILHFSNVFWGDIYPNYSGQFSILKDYAPHTNYSFKVQRTNVGQGYHVWHSEAMDKKASQRILTWILYLNDVEEGGETEFLYYPKRIKPKAGTLILWPAAFTHTHRGNPPISNTKYIITGWVEF